MSWLDFQAAISRHRIIYGVVLAIIISSLLTMISMALYVSSGASRLDLSRPGYEKARSEVANDKDNSTFDTTGPITTEVLNDFQSRYTKQRDKLNGLSTFNSSALDDTQLQIAPSVPIE